jgi:NTP pyrophosphatase (non-canonical NTP hydrolase)
MDTHTSAPQPTLKFIGEMFDSRNKAWLGEAPWTKADWSNAMVGEGGEVTEAVLDLVVMVAQSSAKAGSIANAIKKVRRHETAVSQSKGPKTIEAALENVKNEIGDQFTYLAMLADKCGLDFYSCVRDTFNRVSIREGFSERLP